MRTYIAHANVWGGGVHVVTGEGLTFAASPGLKNAVGEVQGRCLVLGGGCG